MTATAEHWVVAAPFNQICSYRIDTPGDGYNGGEVVNITGGHAATVVAAGGKVVGLNFSVLVAEEAEPTAVVALPVGGTRAKVTLLGSWLQDGGDNIYQYNALEAEAVYGDSIHNKPVVGRAIRVTGGAKVDTVSIRDGSGSVRTLKRMAAGIQVDIAVRGVRDTDTTAGKETHLEVMI